PAFGNNNSVLADKICLLSSKDIVHDREIALNVLGVVLKIEVRNLYRPLPCVERHECTPGGHAKHDVAKLRSFPGVRRRLNNGYVPFADVVCEYLFLLELGISKISVTKLPQRIVLIKLRIRSV